MRTTAISLVISHSACGVQRTWAAYVGSLHTSPFLDFLLFILFSLVLFSPCFSQPPALSFVDRPPSSSHVHLFLSVTLSSSILSLYIQPVDLTSILRTLPDRVQDARPMPRWAAPSPRRASGSSCALIQSRHRIRGCDMV